VLARQGLYAKIRQNPTIFESLRDNPALPPQEKTVKRLTDEGAVLLLAGSETPAKVMAMIHYHLVANPAKLERLREELRTVMGGQLNPAKGELPSLHDLEKLPYLNAVVTEGLRLHNGITARAQRVAPTETIMYGEWAIPPGTPLSTISYFVHYNPEIFPNPRAFIPERWLDTSRQGTPSADGSGNPPNLTSHRLKNYLVAFGKGTRGCIGYNLAYAELYMSIAGVHGRFETEAWETDLRDVDFERDWFIPQPWVGTKGIRVLVTGRAGEPAPAARRRSPDKKMNGNANGNGSLRKVNGGPLKTNGNAKMNGHVKKGNGHANGHAK
jgi:cytochrome P450